MEENSNVTAIAILAWCQPKTTTNLKTAVTLPGPNNYHTLAFSSFYANKLGTTIGTIRSESTNGTEQNFLPEHRAP